MAQVAAAVWVGSLAQELLHAVRITKRKKEKEKKKKKKKENKKKKEKKKREKLLKKRPIFFPTMNEVVMPDVLAPTLILIFC